VDDGLKGDNSEEFDDDNVVVELVRFEAGAFKVWWCR